MPLDHYTPRVGIMRRIRFGKQEPANHYDIGLTFQLDTGTGWKSDVFLPFEQAQRIFNEDLITNVNELNNHPCYYTIENGIIRFKGLLIDSPNSAPWEHDKFKEHEEHEWMLMLHRRR